MMIHSVRICVALSCVLVATRIANAADPVVGPQFSGIYPHLAAFNNEGECGTGAVVPWADRLWVITYGPHLPRGSSDKLYEIDAQLRMTVRPESVGGTPANRMIHRESEQLFIGPYAIGKDRQVRVITPQKMFGRHTGNARHLTDPANKIYYATMEEGLYEVDVKTLDVKELWADEQVSSGRHANLPGYHGKGLYSGQGRVVYANNGDRAPQALVNPTTPSGVLAEWNGVADAWNVILRNQFTEVTGPGGIFGNDDAAKDPIWSIGWDHRSLILMLLDGGKWHQFRLPKASHSYDGAHGWNTEWPRIRDIGEPGHPDFLMTMHGTFWKFPKTFSAANTAGIVPRSNYLKVVGDFCRWNDQVVLGCDDTAKNEFLNKRATKGDLIGPGQSQSNLWFVKPETLDQLGPVIGRGAVWFHDAVKAGEPSDPYLFAGYARRGAHLVHASTQPVTFTFETQNGDGQWRELKSITVAAKSHQWIEFSPADAGAWIRLRADQDCSKTTAFFHYSANDARSPAAAPMFAEIAAIDAKNYTGGLVRARGDNKRNLGFAAATVRDGHISDEGYYELDADMKLGKVADPAALEYLKTHAAVPQGVIEADAASVIITDSAKKRWRLPRGEASGYDATGALPLRVDREVCTERDLLNAFGTFYELPAENASGFAKLRPVSTHNRRITDYCSYRGLLVIAGLNPVTSNSNRHVIASDDGKVALWVGGVDDLWQFGKPRGAGGPWKNTTVKAKQPSDPYLFTGYDRKQLTLSHAAAIPVEIRVEVDISGTGDWQLYQTIPVGPGQTINHPFPPAFQAYWLRLTALEDCVATGWLVYE